MPKYLIIIDLVTRLMHLFMAILALKIASEFGWWKNEEQDCFVRRLIGVLLALAFMGIIVFFSGAVRIWIFNTGLSLDMEALRLSMVRFLSGAAILYTLFKLHSFIIKYSNNEIHLKKKIKPNGNGHTSTENGTSDKN